MTVLPRGATTTLVVVLLSTLLSWTYAKDNSTSGIVILPKTLKPVHYEVKLQPFVNGNFSVHGSVTIELEALVPSHHVILHMTDIITKNESSKLIDKESGREIVISEQRYQVDRSLFIAHLQEQLEEGRTYLLTLEFVGTLGEQPRGFYRSSYTKKNGDTSWVASTQFQSTDARRAFPCFDEPALKATFKIYLARETQMTALSNMPLVKSTPIEDQPGWLWDEFQVSVPMSTYLVAFAISDFSSVIVNEGPNTTLIRVWVRDAVQSQANYGGETGVRVLKFFEDFFDIDFPLPKLDKICPPEMSPNAMENWGLVTYRESGLLYEPGKTSAAQKKWIVYLVSHEVAHQWFGNLVTFKWWTDLWLNEGFATYMGDIAVNHVEPSLGMMDQFAVHRLQKVMALDALKSSHPVSVTVNDPVEINEIFDTISYLKGASILRMMSYFLTEKTFRKGVTNYLTTFQYKNADQDDLWHFLTEAAHEDGTLSPDLTVKTIMDTWTLQKGFPVVTVTRAGNSSAVLTQEQFLLDNNSPSGMNPKKWWIPMTYTTQENPSFQDTEVKFWLNEVGIDPVSYIGYPQPNHWVIFNIQQSGYYRVNYDIENWKLLTQQLQDDHEVIHVTNRAQIIDDALNLARTGRLSYDLALGLTPYLKGEKNYVVWKAALENFQYIYDMFRHDSAYGALREYMLSLILPIYNEIGFEEQPDEGLQTQLLRGEVLHWACLLRHPDCLQRSVTLYRQYMDDPDGFKGVSSNVADAVYCTAVREGEEPEWEFAWQQSLNAALSCSNHLWLTARYLKGAFNESSGIRRQEASRVFQRIAGGSLGNMLAWDYMRMNWNHITDYIGTTFFALPNMVEDLTKSFNTEQLLKELMQFEQDNSGNLLTAKRAVGQAIETTRINVAWHKANRETIVHWLRERGFSSELSDY